MFRLDRVAFAVAVALFAGFFSNVALGAAGEAPFLTDIQEMLALFASVGAFTIGVLRCEAIAKAAKAARMEGAGQ